MMNFARRKKSQPAAPQQSPYSNSSNNSGSNGSSRSASAFTSPAAPIHNGTLSASAGAAANANSSSTDSSLLSLKSSSSIASSSGVSEGGSGSSSSRAHTSNGRLPTPSSSRVASPTSHGTRRHRHAHTGGRGSTAASSASSSTSNLRPRQRARHSSSSTSPTTAVKIVPQDVNDADAADIVHLVSDMLIRLTTHNDSLPLDPSALTRFHSRATPGISIQSYLSRISKYTSLEKACTLILLVYIDRVCERIRGFTICGLTVHRFVCAALVCASKALCDAFSTNGHYARVGGISLVELNMLEKEFLNVIDWRLTCSGELLQHYYVSLVQSHPGYALQEDQGSSDSGSDVMDEEYDEYDDEEETHHAPKQVATATSTFASRASSHSIHNSPVTS